jgi:hypothetical protein
MYVVALSAGKPIRFIAYHFFVICALIDSRSVAEYRSRFSPFRCMISYENYLQLITFTESRKSNLLQTKVTGQR